VTVHDAAALFLQCLSISLPTFGWLVLGQLLSRAGWLSESLNNRISLLAFRFGLPVMLFSGAALVDYSDLAGATYLGAGVFATLAITLLAWLYSRWRGYASSQRGIFVQAAFRSNLAIIGLALAVAAYGPGATALAALPVALLTVLYNVLAVGVLNATHGTRRRPLGMLADILRNPLIIGIGAGVLLALSPVAVPQWMSPANTALSAFFLPLVLICIGGAMDVSRLYRADALTWESCAWRLLLAPALAMCIAYGMGVRGEHLGVLFLLLATPVAASSHITVVAARGDGVLAANIVVLSTLLSVVTITFGFFLLSLFSLAGQLQ